MERLSKSKVIFLKITKIIDNERDYTIVYPSKAWYDFNRSVEILSIKKGSINMARSRQEIMIDIMLDAYKNDNNTAEITKAEEAQDENLHYAIDMLTHKRLMERNDTDHAILLTLNDHSLAYLTVNGYIEG